MALLDIASKTAGQIKGAATATMKAGRRWAPTRAGAELAVASDGNPTLAAIAGLDRTAACTVHLASRPGAGVLKKTAGREEGRCRILLDMACEGRRRRAQPWGGNSEGKKMGCYVLP